MGRCPRICLVDEAPDGTTVIDVNDRLREVRVSELKDLTVGPHGLYARHVQQRYATGRRHMAHLCAHQRVVTQIPLAEVAELGADAIKNAEGQMVVHHVFVSGQALDDAVDASRTRLDLPDGEPLLERAGALDLKTLRDELGGT
jgi:hypothetical protein